MNLKTPSRFLGALVLFTSILALAADEETLKEELLHRIYQKYHAEPTSQEIWEKAISQRTSQEYTIVKGDTLWDVSRTLFADGFFWSKVWSLNPFITNPHQISVGQVIHFYPGAGLDAPGLKVDTTTNVPLLTPQTSLLNTKWWKSEGLTPVPVDLADVTIPPPSKKYPQVLDVFPASLPTWYFQTDAEIDKAPLEILPMGLQPVTNILSLPFFISEFPQDVKGSIFEIEKNAKTASERDYLFVDAEEDLKIGNIYSVIQSIGKIRDPEAQDDFPYSYEVQGEIEIVGRVEGLYKAVVTLALFPIQVGAKIVPGKSPKMNLTEPGDMASLQAMIIGGENDTTRSLFGPQSIVYLNRGSGDGVKVNQRAPIMAVHRLRHADSNIFSNTWKLGEVKIVKVEKNYSTAVVMDATDGIVPGDIVGELKPADINENFKLLDDSTEFGDDGDDSTVKIENYKKENDLEDDAEFDSGSESASESTLDSELGDVDSLKDDPLSAENVEDKKENSEDNDEQEDF